MNELCTIYLAINLLFMKQSVTKFFNIPGRCHLQSDWQHSWPDPSLR